MHRKREKLSERWRHRIANTHTHTRTSSARAFFLLTLPCTTHFTFIRLNCVCIACGLNEMCTWALLPAAKMCAVSSRINCIAGMTGCTVWITIIMAVVPLFEHWVQPVSDGIGLGSGRIRALLPISVGRGVCFELISDGFFQQGMCWGSATCCARYVHCVMPCNFFQSVRAR